MTEAIVPVRYGAPIPAHTFQRRSQQTMKNAPLFEISVTGMEHGEWQGTVTFPASGEQLPFRSLLELMRIVKQSMPMPNTKED